MRARVRTARARGLWWFVAPKGAKAIISHPTQRETRVCTHLGICIEPRAQVVPDVLSPFAPFWSSSFTCDIALNLFGASFWVGCESKCRARRERGFRAVTIAQRARLRGGKLRSGIPTLRRARFSPPRTRPLTTPPRTNKLRTAPTYLRRRADGSSGTPSSPAVAGSTARS